MDNPNTLTIAFDTEPLAPVYRNQGIHVYTRNLLARFRELAVDHGVDVRPFVAPGAGLDANALLPAPGYTPANSRWRKSGRLWRYGGAWLATCRMRPDVIFSPSCNTLQFPSGAARVVTIHDATPVLMPNFAPIKVMRKVRFALKHAALHSAKIITVSQHSKNDLMRVYGLPAEKIAVIYSGYDAWWFNTQAPDPVLQAGLRKKFGLERPYIFHHGFIQPRKNLKRLVQAFRLMAARNSGSAFDLVLAGGLGYQSEELLAEAGAIESPRGRVVLTGDLSDSDLATLLKGSALVVIPSLYEGFCLPMVEAMACGMPVITAGNSCVPEISGNVLRYFAPESVEEMAACMKEVLEDSGLRRELAKAGMARARQFSWRKCAEETLVVLAEAARNR